MRRSLALFALAVVFVVGACGGGGGGSGTSSAYCKGLADAANDVRSSTSTSAKSDADAEAAFNQALDKISKNAPSEIKDDYQVLKSNYVEYYRLFSADPNDTVKKARRDELAVKIQTASKNIGEYNAKVCKTGVTTSTSGSSATTSTAPAVTSTTAK